MISSYTVWKLISEWCELNLRATVFLLMILSSSLGFSAQKIPVEKNYFQFEVANYHTTRQRGQTLNLYVRYAYKENLDTSLYPDYRKLRDQAMKYLEPTAKYPANVYWEILATQLGNDLMRNYPLSAISVQMEVLDNPAGNEPGTHGPVYTLGDISPLDVHH